MMVGVCAERAGDDGNGAAGTDNGAAGTARKATPSPGAVHEGGGAVLARTRVGTAAGIVIMLTFARRVALASAKPPICEETVAAGTCTAAILFAVVAAGTDATEAVAQPVSQKCRKPVVPEIGVGRTVIVVEGKLEDTAANSDRLAIGTCCSGCSRACNTGVGIEITGLVHVVSLVMRL